MAKVPTYEESVKKVANSALDDFLYKGKSLREWIDLICKLDLPNLEKTKTGHWVEENINEWSRKVFCSECGCPPPFEHVSNGDVYSASGYGVSNKTKFCPNCGARME